MAEFERVAVIGAGVAGLTAAWLLRRPHHVTVFEAASRLGGHAHTHSIVSGAGDALDIDSGFIVHNERTYPELLRLFADLGVQTQATEMSMSITCDECSLSYAGGKGLGGILAQPGRLADPRFVRLLRDVPRFHRAARDLLADPSGDPTWAEFLAQHAFSPYFVQHFAVPLVSCVWSAGDLDAGLYPARHLFTFLSHHGMLSVKGSPVWRTVTGGSRRYVDKLQSGLLAAGAVVSTQAPVTAIQRHDDGVEIVTPEGMQRFDRVVLATHADDALSMLVDATVAEKSALGAIGYSANHTVLHTDPSFLPATPRARASWNLALTGCAAPAESVRVSYWMNRLHGLDALDACATDYVVTLNPDRAIDPDHVIAEMDYRHPIFTHEAVAAAATLREAGGPRLAFAGAHLGWGFHEDGARSGVEAARRFGGDW